MAIVSFQLFLFSPVYLADLVSEKLNNFRRSR